MKTHFKTFFACVKKFLHKIPTIFSILTLIFIISYLIVDFFEVEETEETTSITYFTDEQIYEIAKPFLDKEQALFEAEELRKQEIEKEKKESKRVANIHLSLKNKIRLRECGFNDMFCKNKNGNYKVYKDGVNNAIGIASNNYCKKHDCSKLVEIEPYKAELIFHEDVEDKIKIARSNIWFWNLLSEHERDEIVDFNYQQRTAFHRTSIYKHLNDYYSGKDKKGRIKARKIWLKYINHINKHGQFTSSKGVVKRVKTQVNNFFREHKIEIAKK